MKITLTRRISEKIMLNMQMSQVSSKVNYIITETLRESSVLPGNADELREYASEIQKHMGGDKSIATVDKVMLLCMVNDILKPYFAGQQEQMDFFRIGS